MPLFTDFDRTAGAHSRVGIVVRRIPIVIALGTEASVAVEYRRLFRDKRQIEREIFAPRPDVEVGRWPLTDTKDPVPNPDLARHGFAACKTCRSTIVDFLTVESTS